MEEQDCISLNLLLLPESDEKICGLTVQFNEWNSSKQEASRRLTMVDRNNRKENGRLSGLLDAYSFQICFHLLVGFSSIS